MIPCYLRYMYIKVGYPLEADKLMIDYLVEQFLFTPPRPSKLSKAKVKPFLTPI